jgi:hypothetical protein
MPRQTGEGQLPLLPSIIPRFAQALNSMQKVVLYTSLCSRAGERCTAVHLPLALLRSFRPSWRAHLPWRVCLPRSEPRPGSAGDHGRPEPRGWVQPGTALGPARPSGASPKRTGCRLRKMKEPHSARRREAGRPHRTTRVSEKSRSEVFQASGARRDVGHRRGFSGAPSPR